MAGHTRSTVNGWQLTETALLLGRLGRVDGWLSAYRRRTPWSILLALSGDAEEPVTSLPHAYFDAPAT
jgi:hypothetical protein